MLVTDIQVVLLACAQARAYVRVGMLARTTIDKLKAVTRQASISAIPSYDAVTPGRKTETMSNLVNDVILHMSPSGEFEIGAMAKTCNPRVRNRGTVFTAIAKRSAPAPATE